MPLTERDREAFFALLNQFLNDATCAGLFAMGLISGIADRYGVLPSEEELRWASQLLTLRECDDFAAQYEKNLQKAAKTGVQKPSDLKPP